MMANYKKASRVSMQAYTIMEETSGDKEKEKSLLLFQGNPTTCRPPSDQFHCSEQKKKRRQYITSSSSSSSEKEVVVFCCKIVDYDGCSSSSGLDNKEFIFCCREPSYGVLTSNETSSSSSSIVVGGGVSNIAEENAAPSQQPRKNEEEEEEEGKRKNNTHKNNTDNNNDDDEDTIDTDDDDFISFLVEETYPYALVGKTGYQIWPGTRIIIDSLLVPRPEDEDHQRLKSLQQNLIMKSGGGGCKILELGAGAGLVGTMLAASGSQVLITDLSTVVNESVLPNLYRNATTTTKNNNVVDNSNNNNIPSLLETTTTTTTTPPSWLKKDNAISIGKGWAAAEPLDWTKPLDSQQIVSKYNEVDLIISSDCSFLRSMVEPLLDTVSSLFKAANNNNCPPKFLLSCQRRQDFFTPIETLLEEIQARSWNVECIAWYPNAIYSSGLEDNDEDEKDDDGSSSVGMKEVFLFLVEP